MAVEGILQYMPDGESIFILLITFLMSVLGLIIYFVAFDLPAWYGRLLPTNGELSFITIPARIAWFLQESPSFFIPVAVILFTHQGWIGPKFDVRQLSILSCFVLHYFQRSFIYSLLISGGKPVPLRFVLSAIVFTSANGYIQVRGAVLFSSYYPASVYVAIRVVAGMCLFIIGSVINIHSDYVLRNLRQPGETGYKIPTGGVFELVSCGNYFGEIVEWFGFAIASWSIVAFAFAFFTAVYLIPRAHAYHKWYLQKFEDYPKERKSVIPYIL